MTAQQETDRRRAHAASVAMQARIKRENAAHDRRMEYLRGKTMRQIPEEQKQKEFKP